MLRLVFDNISNLMIVYLHRVMSLVGFCCCANSYYGIGFNPCEQHNEHHDTANTVLSIANVVLLMAVKPVHFPRTRSVPGWHNSRTRIGLVDENLIINDCNIASYTRSEDISDYYFVGVETQFADPIVK